MRFAPPYDTPARSIVSTGSGLCSLPSAAREEVGKAVVATVSAPANADQDDGAAFSSLCLDAEDVVRVWLVGQRLPHRETYKKVKTRKSAYYFALCSVTKVMSSSCSQPSPTKE